jgi:hypothetical protein
MQCQNSMTGFGQKVARKSLSNFSTGLNVCDFAGSEAKLDLTMANFGMMLNGTAPSSSGPVFC